MSLLYSTLKPIVRLSVEGAPAVFFLPPEKDLSRFAAY